MEDILPDRPVVTYTYNKHFTNIHDMCQQYCHEVLNSQSADFTDFHPDDLKRQKDYIARLRLYYTSVLLAEPVADDPEIAPDAIELGEYTKMRKVSNSICNFIADAWQRLDNKILRSQSARRSTGMIGPDQIRFEDALNKLENFLDSYAAVVTPMDMPETQPLMKIVDEGRSDVK